ncbi:MAG: type VI secretion system ATPase TssH, partial [Caldilineaceae bacterium SB0675_bin_29]|nr:type VI secretion system ATPase TssH [Caldilineaceae bacterium SB0675_bin_29]
MRFDRLTEKASEAIVEAQNEAREYKHASIEPEHLLLALLRQQGGVVPAVIDRMRGDRQRLQAGVAQLLAAKSRVSGGAMEMRIGRDLAQLLEEAETIAANMKDEYTSTEHLLMAMASSRNGSVRQLLERHGVDYNTIMQGLAAVRGSQRVTSQTPEAQYEALAKYGRDLTAEAGKGNLDPIIGRDQEIRRVVQILSRRTKNNPVLIGEPGVG